MSDARRTSAGIEMPRGHFIDGGWEAASDGERFAVVNPSDEEVLVELPVGSAEDVDRAVVSARAAFPAWSRVAPADRETILRRFADALDASRELLGTLESLDVGKPRALAIDEEAAAAGEIVRFFAGFPTKNFGQHIPVADPDVVCYTRMEPLGVIGAITPWNYPLLIAINKVAPALAAGCTAVVKPPQEAPLSTLTMARIAAEAGLPPGVLNVVAGDHVAGRALAGHPNIAKITFTGSTGTGSAVLAEAAKTVRPSSMELGGKSANIVFDDVDLVAAAKSILDGAIYNNGQECCAGARVLVADEILAPFIDAVRDRIAALRVGRADDPATDLGPLISARHRERVAGFVDRATTAGAEIIARGSAPDGPGFFYPPTVLGSIEPGSEVWCEEIFGPVLTVTGFGSDDEALERANDSRYGLAAGIWTTDVGRAIRFSNELRCGMVWVNSYLTGDPAAPFGGVGDSGFNREMGLAGLQDCCSIKTIYLKAAPSRQQS